MGPQLKLHHVGVVVGSIEEKRDSYSILGYSERTQVIHDPAQTAYVQFFSLPGQDHYLELVAPDGPQSMLSGALTRRQPLNHVCYVVDEIDTVCDSLQEHGWRLLHEPTPALAFNQRRIAWMSSPDLLIAEFVERGPDGSL